MKKYSPIADQGDAGHEGGPARPALAVAGGNQAGSRQSVAGPVRIDPQLRSAGSGRAGAAWPAAAGLALAFASGSARRVGLASSIGCVASGG